jgi:hypothetical protein
MLDGAVDRVHVELVAEFQDRRHRVVDHLGRQVVGAVAHAHLAVAHRDRAGQAARELQLEFGQALEAERAAEADHGRLADVGQARDLGDRLGQHLARMLEHQRGDALLGRRQFVLQVLHALHQRVGAAAPAQVFRQDRRHAAQRRVRRHDHVGRDLRQVIGKAALGFEARAERRRGEPLRDARHDAAADEDAAERAQRHGQVGRRAAQHAGEAFQHFQAQRHRSAPAPR